MINIFSIRFNLILVSIIVNIIGIRKNMRADRHDCSSEFMSLNGVHSDK